MGQLVLEDLKAALEEAQMVLTDPRFSKFLSSFIFVTFGELASCWQS